MCDWSLTKPGLAQFEPFAHKPQTADSLVWHSSLLYEKLTSLMKTRCVLAEFCFEYDTLSGCNDDKFRQDDDQFSYCCK